MQGGVTVIAFQNRIVQMELAVVFNSLIVKCLSGWCYPSEKDRLLMNIAD